MLADEIQLSSGCDNDAEKARERLHVDLTKTAPAYDTEIRTLQRMGFGRASARRALVDASGDVGAAAALLVGRVALRAEDEQAAVQSAPSARSKEKRCADDEALARSLLEQKYGTPARSLPARSTLTASSEQAAHLHRQQRSWTLLPSRSAEDTVEEAHFRRAESV